jgi:hypothetical protein
MVKATALQKRSTRGSVEDIPTFSNDHPTFRLVGAGRGDGTAPGARDKDAILDE